MDNLGPRVVSRVWRSALAFLLCVWTYAVENGERPTVHARLLCGQVFKSALLRTCLSCVEGVTLDGLTFFLFIPESQTAWGPREPLMAIEDERS